MKPRDTANRIMEILEHAQTIEPVPQYIKIELLRLCSKLIAAEPSWGHAERIHKLTGGNE